MRQIVDWIVGLIIAAAIFAGGLFLYLEAAILLRIFGL